MNKCKCIYDACIDEIIWMWEEKNWKKNNKQTTDYIMQIFGTVQKVHRNDAIGSFAINSKMRI